MYILQFLKFAQTLQVYSMWCLKTPHAVHIHAMYAQRATYSSVIGKGESKPCIY